MNRLIITGRIVAQPELKIGTSGKEWCSFTIAVWRNKDTTDFIDCMAFEKNAKILSEVATKGQYLYLEGSLQVSSYKTEDGKSGKSTKMIVEFVTIANYNPFLKNAEDTTSNEKKPSDFMNSVSDDDLPF